jgi:hypothetical protein
VWKLQYRLLHRHRVLYGPRAQSLQIESIGALTFWWSMIFSENRLPLFRIMLQSPLLGADVQPLQHRSPEFAHLVVAPLDRVGNLVTNVGKLRAFEEKNLRLQ